MIGGILSGSGKHNNLGGTAATCGIKIVFDPRINMKFSTIAICYGMINSNENTMVHIHAPSNLSDVGDVSNIQLSEIAKDDNDKRSSMNEQQFDNQLYKLMMKKYNVDTNTSYSRNSSEDIYDIDNHRSTCTFGDANDNNDNDGSGSIDHLHDKGCNDADDHENRMRGTTQSVHGEIAGVNE